MVQLETNNVILPSWMPFISKIPLPVLTTKKCMNEPVPFENNNNDICTVENLLNCLALSDQLMLNYLKDQRNNYKNQKSLKNKTFENFWNWTFHICWMIRCRYLKEYDLEAIDEFENEAKKNNSTIIYLSPSELEALSRYTKCIEHFNGEYEYEYDIVLDTLNLHQSLCLELLNMGKDLDVKNEKKILFLWWFMTYNLLKILNKRLFLYNTNEIETIFENETEDNQYFFNSVTITLTTHSELNYFSQDLLTYSKYYLNSQEENVLLLFFDHEDEYQGQQDLFLMLKNMNLNCQPFTFTLFENEMKNSDFYKEKNVYECIKASKDIQEFTITKQLGKGSSGFVRNAIHNQTGKKVIIKYVVKSLILRGCWTNCHDDHGNKRLPNEIAVLQYLYDQFNGHVPDNLTKLISSWEDSIYYYLVFTDTKNFDTDLFDYIDKNTDKMMSEKEAKMIFRNIAEAIQILHHHHIVHRDIKDENVLINYQSKEIQLIDFGSSAFYKKDQKLGNFVGSFLFAVSFFFFFLSYNFNELI